MDIPNIRHPTSLEDFELLSVLGHGSYGKVLLVKKRDTQALYAMKILKKKHLAVKNQIQHTRTERWILENIKHPYIVKLYYAFQNSQKLYLLVDFCPGGELFFHLSRAKRFDENRARFYAACIVLALDHLHKQNIVYRDLKPENVLLDADGFIKLTDFGLSKDMSNNCLTKTFCGTPEYLAPETLTKQGHSFEVDWWSLGCMIYEMLIGLPPFYTKRRTDIYRKILSEEIKYPASLPEEASDLLRRLLVKDPKKRMGSSPLGAEEIKIHPWFSSIDWDLLEIKQVSPPFVPFLSSPTDCRYFSEEFTCCPARDSTVYDGSLLNLTNSPTYEGFAYTISPQLYRKNQDEGQVPRQAENLILRYIRN
ncbi:unnamed protein product [Blepharisma stoltei]|uniref:Uncharacterized protein n=1 Tax=Blepharisma stoltei TaxID=1481888 RepID=A0AAU9JCU6_9CILI|nr:unnamed protein product [Blepharisma stoltei]